jgi:hypothetical protein
MSLQKPPLLFHLVGDLRDLARFKVPREFAVVTTSSRAMP